MKKIMKYLEKLVIHFFKTNRYRLYIIAFLILGIEIFIRIPYLNLSFIGFENPLLYYLVILAIIGNRPRNLIIVCIIIFFLLPGLVILKKQSLAEDLAVTNYILLFSVVLKLIKDTVQELHV